MSGGEEERRGNRLTSTHNNEARVGPSGTRTGTGTGTGTDDILSHVQLLNLKSHKYNSTSCSLLDPIFQPFWNWLTDRLPLWLAPNLLTVFGLGINIVTALILLVYTPDLRQPVPPWACYLNALGLFTYQTLDAIDGKQARRTKSSSPLGELFDHGCDSCSTVFLTLSVAAACQFGFNPGLTLFHCVLGSLLFYCVHWRTYMTGTLSFGLVDVTEAELTMVLVQLVSGLFGTGFWTENVIYSLSWGHILILTSVPFELYSIGKTLGIVVGKYGVGKNGSTVAGTSVISPAIPIFLAFAPMVWIAVKSPQGVYHSHPALFIVTTGLIASKVTDRLIIAHMTKSDMKFLDRALIGPGLMLLNIFLGLGMSEVMLLWGSLLWTIFDTYQFCSRVCQEICNFLNIKLFSIDYIVSSSGGGSSAARVGSLRKKN
ncbi:unnamed protein product [Allacma fusca]|uniref:diacylglycerol cholinephosphotransferase n=1 Tax=Allacma fusca TaxID=39272 RepID=A0A8J2LFR9_9HEXA|nr:unnamed protein product [Allacma fusca]